MSSILEPVRWIHLQNNFWKLISGIWPLIIDIEKQKADSKLLGNV